MKNYKYIVIGVIVVIISVITLFNTIYIISPTEKAVVSTFGKLDLQEQSGINFKIPFIQNTTMVDTTVQALAIGYNINNSETILDEANMITSDHNFVNVDFYLEYQISEPINYLMASENPEQILKNVAQSMIRTVISSYTVDDVLTDGKAEIQAKIKDDIINALTELNIGITLVDITIQDAEPPTAEIEAAFMEVENAKQVKETLINEAIKYQNELIPQAEAEADRIIKEAEAYRTQRINEATGEANRFTSMYAEFAKNPTVVKERMFYETIQDVLPELTVIVDNGNGTQTLIPFTGFNTIPATTTTEGQ